ncbi:MAG: TetR/AcrR family transcriptional regulator [Bacteroidota bacterium]
MKETIKASRSDHIIGCAREVFFKKGYSKTAISDVCKLAGCSRTTLYSYFASKENLYLAVVEKTFRKSLDHFSQLDLESKTGLERVLSIATGFVDFAQKMPQHYQLMLDFYTILRSIGEETGQTEAQTKIEESPNFEGVKELAQLPLQLLIEEIQRGQEDGTINKDASSVEYMMSVWAYLKGITDVSPFVRNVAFGKKHEIDLERSIKRTIRALLRK